MLNFKERRNAYECNKLKLTEKKKKKDQDWLPVKWLPKVTPGFKRKREVTVTFAPYRGLSMQVLKMFDWAKNGDFGSIAVAENKKVSQSGSTL